MDGCHDHGASIPNDLFCWTVEQVNGSARVYACVQGYRLHEWIRLEGEDKTSPQIVADEEPNRRDQILKMLSGGKRTAQRTRERWTAWTRPRYVPRSFFNGDDHWLIDVIDSTGFFILITEDRCTYPTEPSPSSPPPPLQNHPR